MNEDLAELKQKMMLLSDDHLLQMVTVDAGEYRKEALDCASAELVSRGIDVARTSREAVRPGKEEEPDGDVYGRICLSCGGKMRKGTLVAEKELTIVFGDTREERFVNVSACSQCGQLSMTVDYASEVGS